MRERLARWVALLTVLVTVSLSLRFAWVHNEQSFAREGLNDSAPVALPAPIEGGEHRGRVVFDRNRCANCHSVAGEGNPRYPLDGVGARRTRAELHDWVVGAAALEAVLPSSAYRRKQQYQAMPDDELDALLTYLQSLHD
ncbi:MAG TPA: cytochrome c [Thauera sp.]|uniref:c-type cytochrome n=1 Tax=Thauera sp. TaxID=1905334 RepID=UPI002C89E145|nr:cytochrome c [Thauera sp.]HRP25555.1 cytochrome c [Thauera sp.]HRP67456.1 cytochrome c [Thauera sp.]